MSAPLVTIFRTVFLYLTVLVVMRIMGKRQIGQLQPFELVIAIMIAELAVIPMEDVTIPLSAGLLPISVLLALEVLLSYLSLKSERFRAITSGTPSVVIQNGSIVEKELKKLRYNVNDLLAQLRDKNVTSVTDVEMAILETSGTLSVIPVSQKRPLQPRDLKIPTQYESIATTLVVDGNINFEGLTSMDLDLPWLLGSLRLQGITDIKEVLYAAINTDGQLYVQTKGPMV